MKRRMLLSVVLGILFLTEFAHGRGLDQAALPDPAEYGDSGFGMDVSVYGWLNFGYHLVGGGAGAQFAWPLLPNGFIPSPRFRDAFHIEGGLDFGAWSWASANDDLGLMSFSPFAGVRWAVYVLETLAPFVCVKAGPSFELWDNDLVDDELEVGFYWATSAGVIWDLSSWMSMRVEAGWGRYRDLVRIGVLFRL
ncbi:MAG: hypothetical protein JRF33_17690 [Deltaproteobacteria bacterium]|nr:hypothetical protein [Deltaproteobacteria bacterium]